ncbi:MAG: hypothetical protein L6R45_34200 [Anaerolineae bacterium]|nr:hypothetical protein [Anaerolineae bacterium]
MNDQEKPLLSPEFSPEEAEIARQLFSLRQSPGVELQRRIEAIPQPPARPAGVTPRPLLGGLAALLVAALLFISPPVQATLDEVQKMMGQIPVIVRTVWPQPVETVVVLETEPMSLAQAQAAMPFDFALPAYLPVGLTGDTEHIQVAQSPVAMVKMVWRDAENGFVQLSVYAAGPENVQTLVGPESSETIQLNGQEALLVRGGWDRQSRIWSGQAGLITLFWTVNGIRYRLLAYSEVVSLDELVAMAESIE